MADKPSETPEYARVYEALREARNRAGLTQRTLAERLSLAQQRIAAIETGERRVDVVEFVRIALALGSDPIELFRDATADIREASAPAPEPTARYQRERFLTVPPLGIQEAKLALSAKLGVSVEGIQITIKG